MVLQVHDSAACVSVWAHWARIAGAPHIWEGVVAVFLPQGRLLVSRTFGEAAAADETGSSLRLRCVEPGRRWALRFDGMARPTSTAEVQAGHLADGPVEHVVLDLEFDALTPLWSLHGQMDGQTWGHAHLEQAGRITGTVEHSAGTAAIASFGFRDHSYGPRDYAGLLGDTWCAAVFGDGRALLALHVWQVDGPGLATGFLWDGQGMHPLTDSKLPRLAGRDASPHRFTLEFTTALGRERVEVEQLHATAWGMNEPVGFPAGTPSEHGALMATEGPARITWGDAVADGWIEKALRTSHFGPGYEATAPS